MISNLSETLREAREKVRREELEKVSKSLIKQDYFLLKPLQQLQNYRSKK